MRLRNRFSAQRFEEPQEVATRVVRGMGSAVDGSRARALGVPADESIDAIVEACPPSPRPFPSPPPVDLLPL